MVTHRLDPAECRRRAERIQLVLTDCDGVLTDNGVYVGEQGEIMKRFSHRDGMGVERLRKAGIETIIITKEASAFAARRAEKLRLPETFIGIDDKVATLYGLAETRGIDFGRMAYIGDDVNDLEAMKLIQEHGLVGAPADAMRHVSAVTHFWGRCRGGYGAFREFAEWILELRGSTTAQTTTNEKEPAKC